MKMLDDLKMNVHYGWCYDVMPILSDFAMPSQGMDIINPVRETSVSNRPQPIHRGDSKQER